MNSWEVKIQQSILVTEQDIDDIMVSALEGGITYWADRADVIEDRRVADWGHEQIARGGVLLIHDAEEDEVYELTREKLLDGIKLAYEYGCYEEYEWCDGYKLDCCQIDAEVADCIVQYALFGDWVYG